MYQVLLYYKYIKIDRPHQERDWQFELCKSLNLKGRIIVSSEGINGTVEGLVEDTEKYIEELHKKPEFSDLWFKKSEGTGNAFAKLFVRVRDEIVTTGIPGLDPTTKTGKYLNAEDLHDWIHSDKEFYIVDMRNDYEHKSGLFKDSIPMPIRNFRDLANALPAIESLKGKTVVTVCTGGVRCEKASAFLLENGFTDVYQLNGGIVTYMEKYPNEDFLGKLYVFDGRITMGFNTDSPDHKIIGVCELCSKPSDNYVNCCNNECHRHFICCKECAGDKPYCGVNCEKPVRHGGSTG